MTSPSGETVARASTRPDSRWRPRIVHEQTPPVEVEVEAAAGRLLESLGLDLGDEGLADTPRRMAAAYLELLAVPEFELTTFPNEEAYDELVLVEGIEVRSLCEHHMLPFVGVAHVGYLPGRRIAGLSKLARMVDFHARRPQTQERLTKRIADHLMRELDPRGVGVVITAEHTCMSLRGVRARATRTVTSALFGQLRDDPATRAEFLALTRSGAELR